MNTLTRTANSAAAWLRGLLVLALALSLVAAVDSSRPAEAAVKVRDPERNSQELTGWGWHYNVSPSTVKSFIAQGYRIVDLEVRKSSPRLDVAYVKNDGSYARGWWWYYGLTGSQVAKKVKDKKARLVDIEAYSTSKGTRYAAVMVKNSGAAAKSWGWHYNVPLSTVTSYAKKNKMRVTDVERNPGGNFSAIYIKNKGVDASAWWHYYNVSFSKVKSLMASKQARPLNLERRSNGKYDVVLQKTQGEGWWWIAGATAEQVGEMANQHGARIYQVKSYKVNGATRYHALYLSDLDSESRRVYNAAGSMAGKWGFYLKQVGGAQKVGVGESNVFEPASMIKIVHAVTAMREIQIMPTTNTTPITWYTRPSDPARYPGDSDYGDDKNKCAYDNDGNLQTTNTFSDPLGSVIIAQMMQQSDNRATDALTSRYGFNGLNNTVALAGMTKSGLFHRIGCPKASSPQPVTNNAFTLVDAGRIYEGVQNTSLLDATHRNELYGYMNGGPIGSGALRDMILAEAAAAGLSPADQDAFVARVSTRSKGGSYDSCPNFDGSGVCNPQIRSSRTVGGVIWLPFKTGTPGATVTPIADTPYVYGRYWNATLDCTFDAVDASTCAGFNTNNAGISAVAVEMFRAEVKKALATW